MFYSNRALAYYHRDEDAQALADFSTALMLDPNDTEAYSYRGEVYAALGMTDKAVADFKAALALNPTDIITYGNLTWLSEKRMIS